MYKVAELIPGFEGSNFSVAAVGAKVCRFYDIGAVRLWFETKQCTYWLCFHAEVRGSTLKCKLCSCSGGREPLGGEGVCTGFWWVSGV